MKSFLKTYLLLTGFLLLSFYASSQLIINNAGTAQALAQKLVGDGVTISNVSFTGNIAMTGFFNNLGGTSINIDSGIVLTCGRARSAPGVGVNGASSQLASQSWNLPGDADLNSIITGNTNDACVLEFDFVPLGDTIRFNYVFSSEEYTPAYVCNFNDAFAFFISGPGITGIQNIALVPGTTTPVSIFNVNNVRSAVPPFTPLCPNNPIYYVDNVGNGFFTHDGHTSVFTAESRVQPCERYHMKLVIADVGDWVFDTGVFIEAESLTSNAISLDPAVQTDPGNGLQYLAEGCASGTFTIRRPRRETTPLVVNLSYGGTALNSVDVSTLPPFVIIPANDSIVTLNISTIADLLPEGIEELKIYALGGCGSGTPMDSFTVEIRDFDILNIVPDTAFVCHGGSIQLQADNSYTSYQWTPDPTLSSYTVSNPIATPVNSLTSYICTAITGSCNARDSVLLEWKMMEFVSKTDVNCAGAATGQIRVGGGPEWAQPVQFSIDGVNWQTDSSFNNLPVGTYWVRMQDATCRDSIQITIVQAFPDLLVTGVSTTQAGCSGGPDGSITINGTGGNGVYQYSIDGVNFQTSNTFNVGVGTYTITIRDGNGCTITGGGTVTLNDTVTVDAGPDDIICEGTSTVLNATSTGSNFTWTPSATLNNATILNPTANPTVTTKYYLTANVGICSKTDSMEVVVRPAPIPDAGPDNDICLGRVFQLHGNGGVSYEWSPATHFISPTNVQHPDVRAMESMTYYLMVTDANGCRSLVPDEVYVKVTPGVRIFAGNDTIVTENQPVQLNAKELSAAGVTTWTWSPAFGLSNPNIASPVATLTYEQRYIVTGITPAGCQASDDIVIKVYKGPDIYVPSGFTPNNDGLNDRLHPIPVGIKEFKFFRVYNRWGTLVYSTSDPKRGWDGKVNGIPQYTFSFVWMAEAIDFKGNLITRKGVVTVIK